MKRTRQERIRLGVLLGLMVGFFVLASGRLAQLQIAKSAQYRVIVERQVTGRVSIPAERGMVYDRYGRLVAKNITRQSLYAYPSSKRQVTQVAAYLGKLFDRSPREARKSFRLARNRFRWIKRHLEDQTAAKIAEAGTPGLYLRTETVREYPYGQTGKQILGFTNIDNQGLSGFELSHDSLLNGHNGWADIRRDGRGKTFRVQEAALVQPVPGQSVVLTIDWLLQEIVEAELSRAVTEYNASSGMAVFLDCRSGDILSMAHFDPEEKHPERPTKLRAVTDQFEPGSVFKPFTAAALLDAGLINFDDSLYCEMGRWRVGRRTLHDDKELGWLTFRRIIELSSNIGLAKTAIGLEGEALIAAYRRFGFGRKAAGDFPGETSGSLRAPQVWSDYNIAAMAMGHSIAVSALQMSVALAAIANGGELLKPRLVLGQVEKNGNVIRTGGRQVLHRALQEKSADTLRAFMRGVVENGTGYPANSSLVTIAGKTGTAQIPNPETGGYYGSRYMASFGGFFPAEVPVIAGIVVLEAPRPVTYGGHTSGIAFRQIAERYAVSNPDLFSVADRTYAENSQPLDMTVEVPDLIGRDVAQARMMTERCGLGLHRAVDEGIVVWQYPSADRQLLTGDDVVVAVRRTGEDQPRMIDLKGLTIRKASAFLKRSGIKFNIKGSGLVCRQSIPAGSIMKAGVTCRLVCRPV